MTTKTETKEVRVECKAKDVWVVHVVNGNAYHLAVAENKRLARLYAKQEAKDIGLDPKLIVGLG